MLFPHRFCGAVINSSECHSCEIQQTNANFACTSPSLTCDEISPLSVAQSIPFIRMEFMSVRGHFSWAFQPHILITIQAMSWQPAIAMPPITSQCNGIQNTHKTK